MSSGWAAYFDQAAADYDEATRGDWHPNRHVGEVVVALALAPATVLDLGAGTGLTSEVLAGLLPEAELTLVDGSAGMAAVARVRLPDARVVVADADDFLADTVDTYDLVTAVGFLEMVPDLRRTIAAAAAHLTDGGHLLVTHEPLLPGSAAQSEPRTVMGGAQGRTIRRLTAAEVARAGADAGLELVHSRELVAYRRGDAQDPVVYELVVWARR